MSVLPDTTDLPDTSVKKRAVFFIGGYDPKSAEAFFTRTDRENKRFTELWGTHVKAGHHEVLFNDVTKVPFQANGHNDGLKWETETDFHYLTLDDVVLSDFQRPILIRFWRYLVTFLDYLFTGTAFSFVKHAWRFSLYFFYPATMIGIAIALSCLAASLASGLGLPAAWLINGIVFLSVFATLTAWGGKRYHVLHLMDLWSFSRDFIHNKQQTMSNKLDRFANLIVEADGAGRYDEVLLIGHSTGGALILDAAGRAAEKSAGFGKGSKLTVLTVGSTALKIGLHPSAQWFRKRVGNLFCNHPVDWVEYQCLSDLINFNKSKPAKLMGFAREMQRPFKKGRIKVQDMIEPVTYKRIRKNFFRIHYQFVYGNNKKYFYDFPAICFGPARIGPRIESPYSFITSLTGSSPITKGKK